jgi:hypothetical protein
MGLWKEHFHWSVLLRWDVLEWILAAVWTAAGIMLFFDQYWGANVCFMLSAVIIFSKIGQIAIMSADPWWHRLLFSFLLFGIFGMGIVETVRGVNRWAESKREPKGQSYAALNLPTPKEEAPKAPLGGLEAPSSTRPSNERNLASSNAKTRNLGPESLVTNTSPKSETPKPPPVSPKPSKEVAPPANQETTKPIPAQEMLSTKNIVAQLAIFIDEGSQIQGRFIASNDAEAELKEANEWAAGVQKFLIQYLDASYAIQFRNSAGNALMGMPVNHSVVGGGYWQNIEGKKICLNEFIRDLRQRSQ